MSTMVEIKERRSEAALKHAEFIRRLEFVVAGVMARERVYTPSKCRAWKEKDCKFTVVYANGEWPTEEMSWTEPAEFLANTFRFNYPGTFWHDLYFSVYRCSECHSLKVVSVDYAQDCLTSNEPGV